MTMSPPPPTDAPPPAPDHTGYRPPRTGRVVLVVLGLLGVFGLGMGWFLFSVFSTMRNSQATTTAVAMAERDPHVAAITGTPVRVGRMVTGHLEVRGGGSGSATLRIPVSGPNGSGTVYAEETRGFAGWTPTTLEFWPASDPNDAVRIVEPGAAKQLQQKF